MNCSNKGIILYYLCTLLVLVYYQDIFFMNFTQFKESFEKKEVSEYTNEAVQNPLVSVCVQTYNQVKYIKKSLKSILEQKTDFEFEIVLGDDQSSDGTREICIDYVKKHPDRIRLLLHHRENNIKIDGKPTAIFNSLYNLLSARGDFIAYCDGDDYWSDPYKLQKQVDYLRNNPDTSLTYHSIQLVNKEGNRINKNTYFSEAERDFSQEELLKAIIQPPTCTWCFRNIVNDIPVEFTKSFNGDNFWISLLGNHGKGKYLKNIQPSNYRIHSEAMWSTIDKSYQLKSKYYTYLNLSKYYRRKEDLNLAGYFRVRAKSYGKMYLSRLLRDFKLKKAFLFSIKYANGI